MTGYWFGMLYGTLLGLGVGWLYWKFPAHYQEYKAWKQKFLEQRPRIRAEIERIEGGFRLERFIPNTPPRPPLRERILAKVQEFVEDTAPRSPELVAQQAYRDMLAGRV